MIVPMKHLTLLCVASERTATLERLRGLGTVHLNFGETESDSFHNAETRLADAERALRILSEVQSGKPVAPETKGGAECQCWTAIHEPLPVLDKSSPVDSVLTMDADRRSMAAVEIKLSEIISRYAGFGDFDPAQTVRLKSEGFTVTLFRSPAGTGEKTRDALADAARKDVLVRVLGEDEKGVYGVVIAPSGTSFILPEGIETVALPEERISVWRERATQAKKRMDALTGLLLDAVSLIPVIKKSCVSFTEQVVFVKAADAMQSAGAVSWVTGWIPADACATLEESAKAAGWGFLLRDPTPEETPPTLLRPPKLFRPVTALFQGLGIAPAYSESDVSVPFFCFFSIFFAMLVGDGGYGSIILALTIWGWIKAGKKAPKSWFVLLTCFSGATIAWGILTNTWFGASIPWMDNPVSRWLDSSPNGADANYHHIMLLCFTIGVAHLTVARFWNMILLFPDTKFLAELGWIGVLWYMYFTTCSIVGIFPSIPKFATPMMIVSILFLFLFSLKKSELKTNGIALGMLPLNIVSTLGDIISYVRLFAVGLASVKVAQNFNDMALGLHMPIWLKIFPVILILLLGHGLNFLMAGLSILVHAVRLNTLEFSNHKGISWSGFAFHPFKKMM